MGFRPQLDTHRWILEDLHGIVRKPIWDIWKFIKIYWDTIKLLWWASSPLAQYSSDGIYVWSTQLILPIQITETIGERSFSIQQILSSLDTDDISLNHVWARYKVPDLDEEAWRIYEFMKDDVYSVFKDPAGKLEGMRWLFIWLEDKSNPWKPRIDFPMFEIVLIDKTSNTSPHVQFDVDTLLTSQDIKSKVERTMRLTHNEDPFSWHLDLEWIGKVVSMWVYNNLNGIDQEIWIWNNKRSRRDHRNSMKKIS